MDPGRVLRGRFQRCGGQGTTLKPRREPGLQRRENLGQLGSGGVVERFRDTRLEWLRGRERYLLGDRCKLLGLLGQRLELLACMFGRKLHELRRRLHAGQLLDKVEGGVGVRVSEFDELVVVVLHPLNRPRIAVFYEIARLSRGGAHFFVSLLGLRGALLRHFAKRLRGVSLWETSRFRGCLIGGRIHGTDP